VFLGTEGAEAMLASIVTSQLVFDGVVAGLV
jgi:hypothetical protein